MAWYGDGWQMDQRNYSREQVAEERQMWEQNMEASNHVAFQHFQNFAPYRHNMVNMGAVPGFSGVKFPDGIMFSEASPPCMMGNEMPSTSNKVMSVEEPKNETLDQMKVCWKASPPRIVPEQQQKILPEIHVRKSPDPPPPLAVSQSKPSTSKPSKLKVVKRPRGKNKKKAAIPVSPPLDEHYVSPYQCPVCDKHFEFQASLKTHSLLHGGGGYLYKRALLEKSINLKTKKEPAKTFQCTECGEWFAQSRILERHMKFHTGESPFRCLTCDKTYKSSASLKRHLVSHTTEKSTYSCNLCSKSFAFKEHLQKHMNVHNEDRPYKCTSCDRTFVLEKNLKTHLKAHATQQPYKCSTCNKAFSQPASLYRHMRAHLEGQ